MPTSSYINRASIAASLDEGRWWYSNFRKVPAVTTLAGVWQDLSLAAGYPSPNYYAATPFEASVLGTGIPAGSTGDSTYVKVALDLGVMCNSATPVPLQLMLCDYLLFYPFIDQSDLSEQPLVNTTTLPRYTTGAGVQMMMVLVGAQIGGAQFFVTYTNDQGVSGRVTPTITCNTATYNGAIVSSSTLLQGPFLPLQSGDTGVRYVESVTMLSADVGLMSLVLVKPIVRTWVYQANAANDLSFGIDRPVLPRVYDGAYLNLLAHGQGSLSGVTISGNLRTVWM